MKNWGNNSLCFDSLPMQGLRIHYSMEVSYSCWYLRIQVPFLPLERKKWAGRAGQGRRKRRVKKVETHHDRKSR